MIDFSSQINGVTQIFGRRLIFKDINYSFAPGCIYGISGKNGSGKSTLSKIILGLISPTRGKVIHKSEGKEIIPEKLHDHIGFVSPYLFLYDEFTAWENILFFQKIRGIEPDIEKSKFLFEQFGIYDRRNDLLKGYSSGMKQRIKFIFALIHSPGLLLFDEPTSNLDTAGKDTVYKIIEESGRERIVIIASNESTDLGLCTKTLDVEQFKTKEN
ncbi:MAG: heme ABC exporter ATP-binding protein CcmA [Melioribacteraceae bacterium]|nr:MAG: heme ABC exporter ATP-binding protein CcmA [Melioribacteraceae bacterium]